MNSKNKVMGVVLDWNEWRREDERERRSGAARGSAAREKFTIIARYGRTQRGCSISDLRGVWAAAEYELCHGANDVTIIVNRDRPPNIRLGSVA